MTRDAGFTHADVDVGLLDDPKMRQLIRSTDESLALRCAIGYIATLLTSWQRGAPVALEDAAPLWLTALDEVGEHLARVGLLGDDHQVPPKPWASWFGAAAARREGGRDRWRRWNERDKRNRQAGSHTGQSGTQTVRQSVPTSGTPLPNVGQTADTRVKGTNGHDKSTCPGCGDLLDDKNPNVARDRHGQLWHEDCPNPVPAVAS